MRRRLSLSAAPLLVGAAVALVSMPAVAQQHQQPDVVRGVGATPESARAGAAFARAQRLVAEGQGAAGRAIVDSTLAATAPSSPVYAEGLFWRASLAATAADAERDYRTLAVEYSLSPRSADALLRLAQLELARGDRDLALKHLERLTLEHPTSPARPRASYWMARVYFESSDVPRACGALDAARAGAAPNELGLRAQIDAYAPRCKGGATSVAAKPDAIKPDVAKADAKTDAASSVAAASAAFGGAAMSGSDAAGLTSQTAAGARNAARDTTSAFAGAAVTHAPPPAVVAAAPAPAPAVTTPAIATSKVAAAPFPPTVAAPAATHGSASGAALPNATVPNATLPNAGVPDAGVAATTAPSATASKVTAPRATGAAPAAASPRPSLATAGATTAAPAPSSKPVAAARIVFAVQLAAFDAAAPAEAMAARLRARGLDARVSGAAAPFRVRVGHYATSGAAARAAAALKARGQPAFVVDEPASAAAPAGPSR